MTQVASIPLLGDVATERIPASDPRAGIISVDAEPMSGTPCFAGTRVPIRHLWDYLEGGAIWRSSWTPLKEVPREQVVATLELALERLLDELPAP